MKPLRFLYLLFASSFLLFLSACGGGGGGTGGTTDSGGAGTLSLYLTDATDLDYDAVYVTVDRVEVHLVDNGNGPNPWQTVAEPKRTYNLLELVNGVREHLGLAELEAGDYTQMRLIIGETPSEPDDSVYGLNIFSQPHPFANYVVLKDTGEIHELKVPSGPETGIKIVHGFTINEDKTTELILDFVASESVVKAGRSGQWLLKPTIKVLNTEEYCIVGGTVEDKSGVPIPGALVSAQTYNPTPSDIKDQVRIQTSTRTDADGQYKLFLKPGSYNIVAFATGYFPTVVCADELDPPLEPGEVVEELYFGLLLASSGTVSGEVTISGSAEEDQHATISLRQFVDCDVDATGFEVISVNVANGGEYNVTLPTGEYELVASSYGKTTEVIGGVNVSEGEDTPLALIDLE
jgi:hypothetical protein